MTKKKINWKKITAREYGVQYSEMQIRSLTDDVKEFLPFTSYQQIIIPEEGNQCFLIAEDKWNKIVKSLHKKYSASLPLLDKFEKQFREFGAKYLETAKTIAQLDLRKLTNKDLWQLYIKYQQDLLNYCVFVWAGWILNNLVAEKAKSIAEEYIKKSKKKKEEFEILESLFRPVRKAAIIRLQEEVEKLQGNFQSQTFQNLYLKYRWLSCLDIHNRPWTKKEFKDHIKSFKKEEKKKYISSKKILEQLKVKKKDQVYLEMARRFAYIMDARDDYRRQAIFHAQKFLSEIAKRMDLKLEDASYLQEKEIIAFLQEDKKVPKTIIKQRQGGFVLYYDKKKNIVCKQGKQIKPTLKKLGVSITKEEIREIKGIVACKGKVKGKVTIVKGVKDLSKVKRGDIMVAITTHPDYVPAMRKALAIVTDEGGTLCHAAIVSREYGIPAIVGTQNATRVLRDGDKIEVNGSKGLVRVIRGRF